MSLVEASAVQLEDDQIIPDQHQWLLGINVTKNDHWILQGQEQKILLPNWWQPCCSGQQSGVIRKVVRKRQEELIVHQVQEGCCQNTAVPMTMITTATASGIYPDFYIEQLLKNINDDHAGLFKYMPQMCEDIEYKK
jgi:hypothetical protein